LDTERDLLGGTPNVAPPAEHVPDEAEPQDPTPTAAAVSVPDEEDTGDEFVPVAVPTLRQSSLADVDAERLEQLLTEFSSTPLFARTLAGWTGPAAAIVAADGAREVSRAAYVAPEPPARHSAPVVEAPAKAEDRSDSSAFAAEISGGMYSTVVAAYGEVRSDTVGLLSAAAWRALSDGPTELVVDLRGITLFNAVGLHALLDLREAAADVATNFRLRAPSDAVRSVIEAESAQSAFEIDEDEDAQDQSAPWLPPDPADLAESANSVQWRQPASVGYGN
jgi:anti-anti-sigma regulatory factor